ncbi:MAG: hypothetical protein H0X35_15290 [Pseudonocardiales bacterium]|nr:hypothetical protein [Pseudonocardiales bacterium]
MRDQAAGTLRPPLIAYGLILALVAALGPVAATRGAPAMAALVSIAATVALVWLARHPRGPSTGRPVTNH